MSTPPDDFQIQEPADKGDGLIDTLTMAELAVLLAQANKREAQAKLADAIASNLA